MSKRRIQVQVSEEMFQAILEDARKDETPGAVLRRVFASHMEAPELAAIPPRGRPVGWRKETVNGK